MTKKKTGDYTKTQERALLAILYQKGRGPHTQQIYALADKWGRGRGAIWQKWYSLHGKGSGTPKARPAGIDKRRQKDILPMTFKAIEFDDNRLRVNPEEEMAMQKGLEEAIIGPLSTPKRAILFPTRLVNRAKEYLKKKHPRHVFSFHTNKSDRRYMLLAKKV